ELESEVGQNLYASAVEKLNKILPKHIDFRNGVAFLDPPSEVQRQFRTGLIRASERGDAAAVALFLKLPGVEVNAADKKGVTALMSASCGEVAKLLLDAPQILVNAKDREGRTALMHALGRTNAEVAQVLLEDPAIDAHLADHGGCTTLKYALKGKNVEVLVLLLKVLGIHVDLTDDQKRGMLSRMLQTKGPEAATHRVPISDTRPH
ncbi:ankyrin repeat-containing domain protein, partial [Coprinopsis sp. MPI-PUGE-AT-0042]